MYKDRLTSGKACNPVWVAVEWAYLGILMLYHDGATTQKVRSKKVRQVFEDALNLLNPWIDDPGVRHSFFDTLKSDWELEFFTNYLLSRPAQYASDEYQKIIQKCAQHPSGGCK